MGALRGAKYEIYIDDHDDDGGGAYYSTSANLQGTVECAGPYPGHPKCLETFCCTRAPTMPRESALS